MKMYDTPQAVERYLNVPLECSCGKTHFAPIKAINISKGALDSLPGYVSEYGYKKPYLLCDSITYKVAGEKCESCLKVAGFEPSVLIIRHLGFDEATLGEIVINKPDDCDLMIGIGTGSITDMTRYSSYKLGLPCFTVATGAPMDGFSASVGIMNVNNLKATMQAHSTEVIIGDTDVLKTAPYRMTIAGFADLIGKLNALNDWRLEVLVTGAHYCKKIDELVTAYVNDILSKADLLKARDPEAIGNVMNALLLTGATISLYGNSRPISGAEHHMSHYWEVLGEQRGQQYAMHGEQVAVGTVMALSAAEELSRLTPDFERARAAAKVWSYDAWEAEIRRTYGNAADAIIGLEKKADKNGTEGRLRRIDFIEAHWEEIRSMLAGLYPAEKLRQLLKELGCPCDPKDIGITEDVLRDTFAVCKETRARYTIYQMAWDLDLTGEISDSIIRKLKEQNAI